MKVHIRAYGETAYLVSAPELERLSARRQLDHHLCSNPPGQFVEHVWGARTVLLIFRSAVGTGAMRSWFSSINLKLEEALPAARVQEVPVVYEGPDLEWLGRETGLSREEVIAVHSRPVYTVRMMGFSPGFPYLDGLDQRLHVERRAQPRKRIKAGSVAIGGPHAGIYSIPSPGGWHLLGHTDRALFEPEAAIGDAPAPRAVFAFQPGDRIRFMPQ